MIAAKIRRRRSTQRRWYRSVSGFSLFEVLIAILVASLFFLVVIQSSTVSSVNRASALEASEALSWIQQDLESIRFQAGRYRTTRLQRNALTGDLSISVESTQDFDTSDEGIRFVDPNQKDATFYKAKSIIGNQISLAEPKTGLVANHNQGVLVFGVSALECQATNFADGMGYGLRSQISTNNSDLKIPLQPLSRTVTSTNKQFIVERALEVSKFPPYRSLTVRYTVNPPIGTPAPFLDPQGNPREFATEVIPDVAFYCP